MSALQLAKENLSTPGVSRGFLSLLVDKGFIQEGDLSKINTDQELASYLEKASPEVVKKKKVGRKRVSSNLERNQEAFDQNRCSARIWKEDSGLGFDNIQCTSQNIVSIDEASEKLRSFKMDESQEKDLDSYLKGYTGCFCKRHLAIDFFMPHGYWLGKGNEPRPEVPKLPVGSLKKGFSDEKFKVHKWMYDSEGNKVEKVKRKKSLPKEKPATPSEMEEFRKWKEEKLKGNLDTKVSGENKPVKTQELLIDGQLVKLPPGVRIVPKPEDQYLIET